MNNIVISLRLVVALPILVIALCFVFSPLSVLAAPGKAKGPKCQYRDLDSNKIITYDCDRFQSKGDRDSITPQVKIIEPEEGAPVLASELVLLPNGLKAVPIKIVVSPEFVIDFTQASNAGTQYLLLPQVDGLGHLHSYIAPVIDVKTDVDGNILDVQFVGNDNRSDMNGGFCVFRNAGPESTPDYQVLNVDCPLQAFDSMDDGEYKVSVDFTENSHGPRMKNHPRDVPPGDQVTIEFTNDLAE